MLVAEQAVEHCHCPPGVEEREMNWGRTVGNQPK